MPELFRAQSIQKESKVIIHKFRSGVSLVEQDTIESVSVAYLQFIIIFLKRKIFSFYLHFSVDSTVFLKKFQTFFLPMKT